MLLDWKPSLLAMLCLVIEHFKNHDGRAVSPDFVRKEG
jgi:hypothetical protein